MLKVLMIQLKLLSIVDDVNWPVRSADHSNHGISFNNIPVSSSGPEVIEQVSVQFLT
jgi:hypothetical protein